MNGEKLYESIGVVDDEILERSELRAERKPRVFPAWRTAAAACLCVAAICAAAAGSGKLRVVLPSGIPAAEPEAASAAGTESTSASADTDDVLYSSLKFPQGTACEETEKLRGNDAALCYAGFCESSVQKYCGAIVEGTVTKIYVKDYAFDEPSDKFEKGGVLHGTISTVVYELKLDKVWYGSLSGDTVVIQDEMWGYFADEIFALKQGCRYVIPLDTDVTAGRYSTERVSPYSTFYPFMPQIEVTLDGNYVVASDWTTLTAENARKVEMDCGETSGLADIYRDKMRLVDGATFAEQMAVLLKGMN